MSDETTTQTGGAPPRERVQLAIGPNASGHDDMAQAAQQRESDVAGETTTHTAEEA